MKSENKGEIVIYKAKDGKTVIDVRFKQETVSLNQYQLADLFTIDRTSILRHIGNIHKTGELIYRETIQ